MSVKVELLTWLSALVCFAAFYLAAAAPEPVRAGDERTDEENDEFLFIPCMNNTDCSWLLLKKTCRQFLLGKFCSLF